MYVVDGGIECMVRCCIFMPIRSHFSNVGIDVPIYSSLNTLSKSYPSKRKSKHLSQCSCIYMIKHDIKIITKAINFTHKKDKRCDVDCLQKVGCLYKCLHFVFTNFVIRKVKYSTFFSPPCG
jgi:hypothetical protein